ncbi:hypothetical protein J5TS2_36280 [Brevibacillus halotolerans]|nr:hypothetical protein J5TS2_36280 [Brevibacillus halotolerans]
MDEHRIREIVKEELAGMLKALQPNTLTFESERKALQILSNGYLKIIPEIERLHHNQQILHGALACLNQAFEQHTS